MDGFIPKPVDLGAIARALGDTGVGVSDTAAAPRPPGEAGAEPEQGVVAAMPEPLEKLLTLVGGDQERFGALLAKHLDHASQLVADMEAAHVAGDGEALSRHAHSLKSSSAMFGAERVRHVAARLQTTAEAGDLDAVGGILGELRAATERDGALLRAFCVAPAPARAAV